MQNSITLTLPNEMIGKPIEITAVEVDEIAVAENSDEDYQKRLNNLQSIFADCQVDLSNFKFNRDEANNYE